MKTCVAFAANKARIAVGEGEAYEDEISSVYVIDLDTGTEVFRQKLKKNDGICGLAISADGSKLVYGTAIWDGGGNAALHRYDLDHNREDWQVTFAKTDLERLIFLPGEKQLLASAILDKGDYESAVYLIDADSGKVQATRSAKEIGLEIALSPTENLIACAHNGGRIELLRFPGFQVEKRLADDSDKRRGLCSIAFSPNGKRIVVGDVDGRLTVYER